MQTLVNCAQPPDEKVKDYASFTDAELRLYGLPPRSKGESLAHWQKIVRAYGKGKRLCTYQKSLVPDHKDGLASLGVQHAADINSAGDAHLNTWAGNIVDEPVGGSANHEVAWSWDYSTYYYNEIDADWYQTCFAAGPTGTTMIASWIGLGGSNSVDELLQVGTQGFLNDSNTDPVYSTWVDYVGDAGSFVVQTACPRHHPHATRYPARRTRQTIR